jgi:urea carboxylase
MTIDVIDGGLYSTVQDYPGRVGYWDVGIPPSGPMDAFAFCVGNALVGNDQSCAGLEMTARGVTLRFREDAVIALCGARLQAKLDDAEAPWWQAVEVGAGSVLKLRGLTGAGFRTYLAVAGGIDVPVYLGSRATFPFAAFGGYQGRPLKKGDELITAARAADGFVPRRLPDDDLPAYAKEWEIGVVPGPHEAPDFFTPADVDMFYETSWAVHYNSNRLGYRLVGPRPHFARKDGGEGGRHPSNLPDTPYAIGMVNFTGDMPIILTVDGPSLGGFVSMVTVPTTELWKVGQAMPGDRIRFRPMTVAEAAHDLAEFRRMLTVL